MADLALLRVAEGQDEEVFVTISAESFILADSYLDQEVEDSMGAKRLVKVKVDTVGVWRQGTRVA